MKFTLAFELDAGQTEAFTEAVELLSNTFRTDRVQDKYQAFIDAWTLSSGKTETSTDEPTIN